MKEKEVSKSTRHDEVRNSLPDELKPVFDQIVEYYKHYAMIRHGHPWVSYLVLADLVRDGWRCVEDPVEKK